VLALFLGSVGLLLFGHAACAQALGADEPDEPNEPNTVVKAVLLPSHAASKSKGTSALTGSAF
jgi:hypothetical protein